MKILFANMLEPAVIRGHRNLDQKNINFLSKIGELHVLLPQDNDYIIPQDVIKHTLRETKIKNNKHFYSIIITDAICRLDTFHHFDYIFFESFDTYGLAYAYLRIKLANNRIIVLHHNNIDYIEQSWKAKLVFLLYAKKITHITLAGFLSNHLSNYYGIPECRVHTVLHPICNRISKSSDGRIINCIGISNSNDENWINEIISFEEKNEWFSQNKIKAVFKSKSKAFDNGYLKVVNKYLSDEEYSYYFANTICVFLPFPHDFCYRMSGSLVDSLSNNIVAIGTPIPLFNYYSEMYPNICKKVMDIEQFLNVLLTTRDELLNDEFQIFRLNHSDDSIVDSFRSFLCTKGSYYDYY